MVLASAPAAYAPLVAAVMGIVVLFIGKAGNSAIGALSRWLDSLSGGVGEDYGVELPQLESGTTHPAHPPHEHGR